MPAPLTSPVELNPDPSQNTESEVLFSPLACRTTESPPTEARPEPVSSPLGAGPAPKLLQPSPGAAGGFPHGQGMTPPTPGTQPMVPGSHPGVNPKAKEAVHSQSQLCPVGSKPPRYPAGVKKPSAGAI